MSHSDSDEVLEGYTESFRGAVSDPDHAAEDLTATWYLDGKWLRERASDADGISLCDVLIPSPPPKSRWRYKIRAMRRAVTRFLTVVPESPEAEIQPRQKMGCTTATKNHVRWRGERWGRRRRI